MTQIEVLGASDAGLIHAIVKAHQDKLKDIAQLNWDLDSLTEVLIVERVIGLVHHNKKTSNRELLSFIIYRDLISIAEILLLGTKIDQQSKGLMKTLLDSLKMTYTEIWLEVHEQNTKAHRLYEKESFKLDGVRLKYYTDGKSALVMSWKRGLAIC